MSDAADRATLNALGRLKYHDPVAVLRNFRHVETRLPNNTPDPIKHLRTNGLKRWREYREAALFCYGISRRLNRPIYFNLDESADHDFVAMWEDTGVRRFAPVQLKELVPEQLNKTAAIGGLLQNLVKYSSDKLTVAIHLNRRGAFEPSALLIPPLHVAALWFFWGASQDQSA